MKREIQDTSNPKRESLNNLISVFLIYQQPPFTCPFVRMVVRTEDEANGIIRHLQCESNFHKFWKKKFEVLS